MVATGEPETPEGEPRGPVRRGADALVRLELSPEECASGVSHELRVDCAVVCDTCCGFGCAAGAVADICEVCVGRGEVHVVQGRFSRREVGVRGCPACHGFGATIAEPCPQCGGDGRVQAVHTITARISPGVTDGMRVRLSGAGEAGPRGGPAGDLYIEVHSAKGSAE